MANIKNLITIPLILLLFTLTTCNSFILLSEEEWLKLQEDNSFVEMSYDKVLTENLPEKLERTTGSETYKIDNLNGDYIFFLMYDDVANKGNIEVYNSKNEKVESFKNRDNNFSLGRAVSLRGAHYFKVSHVTGKAGSLYTVCVVRLSPQDETSTGAGSLKGSEREFNMGLFNKKLECIAESEKLEKTLAGDFFYWPEELFNLFQLRYYFFAVPLISNAAISTLDLNLEVYKRNSNGQYNCFVISNKNKEAQAEGFYCTSETSLKLLVSDTGLDNAGFYIVGWGKE